MFASIKNKASSILKKNKTVKDAKKATKDVTDLDKAKDSIVKNGGELVDAAKKGDVKTAGKEAKEVAKDAGKIATLSGGSTITQAKDMIGLGDKKGDDTKEPEKESKLDALKEKAEDVKDDAEKKIEDAGDALEKKAGELKEESAEIVEETEEAAGDAAEAVGDAAEETKDAAAEKAEEAKEAVEEKTQ